MKKTKGTLTNLLMVLLMAVALATPVAVQAEQGICLEKAPAEWIFIQEGEKTGWISSKLEQIKGFVQIDGKDYLIWKDEMTLELIECLGFGPQEVQSAPEDAQPAPELEVIGLDWPVEADIKTKADFFALEKLPAGYYEVEGTNVSILIEEYQNGNTEECHTNAAIQVDHTVVATLDNAKLVKETDTLALWGESFRRSLDRVDLLADEISVETDLIWTDFPSYKDMGICGSWVNSQTDDVTFGECQTDIGWHYGLYCGGEERGEGLDVESRLHFQYQTGIAVDEDGKVYMLYFSAAPWSIQLVEVDMPVKVDYVNDFWYITDTCRDDNSYGYAGITCGGKEYIIKTEEPEALRQNGMDNMRKYPEPLAFKPTYEVVEAIPENFETFDAWYGTDGLQFYVEAYFPCEDGYGNYFSKTFHFPGEIDNHWLGMLIPREQFFNMRTQVQLVDEFVPEGESLWYIEDCSSWAEVEAKMEKLDEFLDKWEKSHEEEIVSFFMADPRWAESEPEDAAKYGIRYDGERLVTTSENLEKYFEHFRREMLSTGYGEAWAEGILQEYVNQYFIDYPEVFEAHREVAAQYGVKAMDAQLWLEYLKRFGIWDRVELFDNNPDVQKILPIFYRETMAEYAQLLQEKNSTVKH